MNTTELIEIARELGAHHYLDTFEKECICFVTEELQQFAQRIEQCQWRPIETAPKDGTEILGWNDDSGKPEEVVWRSKDYWCSSYYYLMSDGDSVHGYDLNITHWMPTPTPPQVTK